MNVPFAQIPDNLRTPLFFAELDNSQANTNASVQRALLIGQKTAAGTLTANVPVLAQSQSNTRAAAGSGSILAGMIDAYRANDAYGEMWVLPLADDPQATAASGTITFTGTTTATGTLSLYIAGQVVAPIIASGQTAAQVAATAAAAINAATDLPVTATVAAGVVTLTAKNKGECGNDIDLRVNYGGSAADEALPAGLAIAFGAMAGGATNPSLTAALSALLDTSFDFIACSLTDATSLAAITALLSDATGRWAWSTQVYGHCWIAKRGSAGTVAAFASGLNAQHLSCIGFADSPHPAWCWAAAFAGASAPSLRADPGIPVQFLSVAGILPPPLASRYPLLVRNNTLLYGGVATWTVDDASGTVVIENTVTTYVTNAQGQADDSYLEAETLFQLAYCLRFLKARVLAKFGRVKIAADGTRLLPGNGVVTPSVIRADQIAAYRELEEAGQVQGSDVFAANLVVEKVGPRRVNVLWPGVLTSGLRIFALLAQFRLQ